LDVDVDIHAGYVGQSPRHVLITGAQQVEPAKQVLMDDVAEHVAPMQVEMTCEQQWVSWPLHVEITFLETQVSPSIQFASENDELSATTSWLQMKVLDWSLQVGVGVALGDQCGGLGSAEKRHAG